MQESSPAVLAAREPHLPPHGTGTLADLYDPKTMPRELVRAHAGLDRAVERCYRPEAFRSDRERVEHLFRLHEQLTAPLLPATKAKRTRKATGLYAQKPRKVPTGTATPESEAAAAHFHIILGEEKPLPYRTAAGAAPDATGETPRTQD